MKNNVERLFDDIINNSKKETNISLDELAEKIDSKNTIRLLVDITRYLAEKGYDIISTNPIRIRKYDI